MSSAFERGMQAFKDGYDRRPEDMTLWETQEWLRGYDYAASRNAIR